MTRKPEGSGRRLEGKWEAAGGRQPEVTSAFHKKHATAYQHHTTKQILTSSALLMVLGLRDANRCASFTLPTH